MTKSEWRSMETAPKGWYHRLLLRVPSIGLVYIGYWHDGAWRYETSMGAIKAGLMSAPAGWMPLPGKGVA